MSNKRLYVDFHVIQTMPPSCVNRDDAGRPKTAIYGGTNRARVSSQAWKHEMRIKFRELFQEEDLGVRTKNSVRFVANKIKDKDVSIAEEKALKYAEQALNWAGIKTKDGKNSALFFISSKQAEALAELKMNGEKDKKKYIEAVKSNPSIDIALFGRMSADASDLNVDASAQVAHSISTHAVQNEFDYFTAVDDIPNEDTAGAGHLGTMEFNSSTLYRYATLNVEELFHLIGESTPNAVKGFADAFVRSMPTGKQNSYANRTMPDLVYVTIRKDQPINLSGAFEKAIRNDGGYVENSKKALLQYADKVYTDYCGSPEKSYIIGYDGGQIGAENVNFRELLDKICDCIKDNEVI